MWSYWNLIFPCLLTLPFRWSHPNALFSAELLLDPVAKNKKTTEIASCQVCARKQAHGSGCHPPDARTRPLVRVLAKSGGEGRSQLKVRVVLSSTIGPNLVPAGS